MSEEKYLRESIKILIDKCKDIDLLYLVKKLLEDAIS